MWGRKKPSPKAKAEPLLAELAPTESGAIPVVVAVAVDDEWGAQELVGSQDLPPLSVPLLGTAAAPGAGAKAAAAPSATAAPSTMTLDRETARGAYELVRERERDAARRLEAAAHDGASREREEDRALSAAEHVAAQRERQGQDNQGLNYAHDMPEWRRAMEEQQQKERKKAEDDAAAQQARLAAAAAAPKEESGYGISEYKCAEYVTAMTATLLLLVLRCALLPVAAKAARRGEGVLAPVPPPSYCSCCCCHYACPPPPLRYDDDKQLQYHSPTNAPRLSQVRDHRVQDPGVQECVR